MGKQYGVLHYRNGPDQPSARQELWNAIDACLGSCNRTYADVVAICVGMCVRESQSDLQSLRADLQQRFPLTTLQIAQTDAAASLASGTGGVLHGCVLIAGASTMHGVWFAQQTHECKLLQYCVVIRLLVQTTQHAVC